MTQGKDDVRSSKEADLRASVVIPTRNRAEYLMVTLTSLVRQTLDSSAYEVVVVDDGSTDHTAELVATVADQSLHDIRLLRHPSHKGINAARNTGVRAARADLIVLIDDDVEVPSQWLASMVNAAERYPEHDLFAGPIYPRLEGFRRRTCDPMEAPITTLDLGREDHDTDKAWGTNMALRCATFERIGEFREDIAGGGDEEEWEMRLRAGGGRIMYVGWAGLWHRRNARDSRLIPLCKAAYQRGRNMRDFDNLMGDPPSRLREIQTAAACLGHAIRRRCAYGLMMAAHAAGRAREAFIPRRKSRS